MTLQSIWIQMYYNTHRSLASTYRTFNMDDFRFEEEHILFDIAIDKWHKDSIDKTSVIRTFTFPPWYAGNDIRRQQMWTFAQKIQTEDIALALHSARKEASPREFLRLILAVHNPVFRASQLGVLIEHLYIEFLMEYISTPEHQNPQKAHMSNYNDVFEYYALQLGWQGSHAHFAVHLLTNPNEKMSTITYFKDYCNRNYEKFICSQKTEDFTTQQMELDIQRMKFLVTYPFVLDDENIDLAEIDLEKKPRKKRTRKPRIRKQKKTNLNKETSQRTNNKPKPVLATYHPEHLVSPEKQRYFDAEEETYFSARKFVFLLDRAFSIFQDEELTVGWSRLKAQIESYGQKVYEDEYDDPDEIYDCAYCDLVTAFDWTYYAYYHQGSDCEEETPNAIIDALYAFFHTQTRSFPYRIAYFHFLFLVAAEFADGHSTLECIQKTNHILSAHFKSRLFDCAGYRTAMLDDMNVQFAKKEVLSAS